MISFWFLLYSLQLSYGLGALSFLVYYSARYSGVALARLLLKAHRVHPRHQSVNKVDKGAAMLIVINHEEKSEDARAEVKLCLRGMLAYGAAGSACFLLCTYSTGWF